MKFNEEDLQSNIMDLIQEREKYRMQALKYREALEELANCGFQDDYYVRIAKKALKAGDDV